MSNELLEIWGNNVKTIRGLKGLTVAQFAQEMGVSVATVSRWEAGKMAPKDDNKVEIATVLEVDVRTLFPLTRPVTV
jgi:transcriptional regulator with XRE-family HTH domain